MDSNENILNELEAGFQVAYKIIDNLLSSVNEKVYYSELLKKIVPYSINCVSSLIFNTVDVSFLRREIQHEWVIEEEIEPVPTTNDSWARSIVPVKKKQVNEFITQQSVHSKSGISIFKSNALKSETKFVLPEVFKVEPMVEPELIYDPHEEFLRNKKIRQENLKNQEKLRLNQLKIDEKKKKQLIVKKFRGKVPKYTHGTDGKLIIVSPIRNFDNKECETVDFKILETQTSDLNPKPINEEKATKTEPIFHVPIFEPNSANILEYLQVSPRVSLRRIQDSELPPPKPELVQAKPGLNLKLSEKKLKVPAKYLKKLISSPENITNKPEARQKPWNTQRVVSNLVKSPKEIDHGLHLSPVDRFNLDIMESETWGANPSLRVLKLPARVPKNNTLKDDWEAFGHIFKKPKDCPFALTSELMLKTDKIKKPKDRKVVKYASKANMGNKISGYFSP